MIHFELLGHLIACDVAVPHRACSAAPPSRPIDAVVQEDASLEPGGPAALPRRTRGPAGEGLSLDIPGVARFDIEHGGTIRYRPAAQGDTQDLGLFLLESILPLWCQLRGDVVLRAAAVRDGDGASVLLGASACGKSTLACALGDRGMELLGDGFCRLALDGHGHPRVFASGLGLRLRSHSFELLHIGHRRGPRLRPGVDRFITLPAPPAGTGTGLPLRRLYLLGSPDHRGGHPPTPAPLLDAMACLQGHAWRAALVDSPQRQRQCFTTAAAIVRHAQVLRLNCPWGRAPLLEFADALVSAAPGTRKGALPS